MRVHHLPLLISRTCTILDETNLKKQEILELVIIRNEILEVPNLKLVFLTFERSERSHWFFARENDFNPMGYLCTGLSKRIATLMVNSTHMDL